MKSFRFQGSFSLFCCACVCVGERKKVVIGKPMETIEEAIKERRDPGSEWRRESLCEDNRPVWHKNTCRQHTARVEATADQGNKKEKALKYIAIKTQATIYRLLTHGQYVASCLCASSLYNPLTVSAADALCLQHVHYSMNYFPFLLYSTGAVGQLLASRGAGLTAPEIRRHIRHSRKRQ